MMAEGDGEVKREAVEAGAGGAGGRPTGAREPAGEEVAQQGPKFQSFCGTLCSHKAVVLYRGKLLIINQLYHKTRPYTLPLLRNPG